MCLKAPGFWLVGLCTAALACPRPLAVCSDWAFTVSAVRAELLCLLEGSGFLVPTLTSALHWIQCSYFVDYVSLFCRNGRNDTLASFYILNGSQRSAVMFLITTNLIAFCSLMIFVSEPPLLQRGCTLLSSRCGR